MLGVFVRVCLDEISIWASRLRRADYPPLCGQASSNPYKDGLNRTQRLRAKIHSLCVWHSLTWWQESPTSWIKCLMVWDGVVVIIIEIKCTINGIVLNHPETTHPPILSTVHGKTVFHEMGPWCQKGWGWLAGGTWSVFSCLQTQTWNCDLHYWFFWALDLDWKFAIVLLGFQVSDCRFRTSNLHE